MNTRNLSFLIILAVLITAGVVLVRQKDGQDPATVPQRSEAPPPAQTPLPAPAPTPSPTPPAASPEPQQPQPPVSATPVVTYTDEGYSPSTLQVKSGSTVLFRNQSSMLMWTASDPHPVHNLLSEFDPRQGFATGESYQFTFTESGSFGYHNHLRPGHGGTIIVE